MSEENVLLIELDKLDLAGLKRVAQAWNLPKIGKDKKAIVKDLIATMQEDFYLKGVLEKLSATQVTIYTSILKSKSSIMTLGEVARKINMPSVNAEMELGVLKRYQLVYQRKNRERLTNNLDKYYFFPESGNQVRMDGNDKGQKFKLSLVKTLQAYKNLPPLWKKIVGSKGATAAANTESIRQMLEGLTDNERDLIQECFLQGGILEIAKAREFIEQRKQKWTDIVPKLHENALLIDDYYVDEKFIRILVLPTEIITYLQEEPILPREKKGTKKRTEKKAVNDLDFYLNIKKMIVYISRKGLNLAKSGKIKQVDLKETENRLLRPDIGLFIEKSQIYQIELLLPVMRLLDIVRVKRDDVVLRNEYEEILQVEPFALMSQVMKEMVIARDRRVRYEDAFEPLYVPFYLKSIFDECVAYIAKRNRVILSVILGTLTREKLILNKNFRIKNFQQDLADLRRELTSALFYLQLLGLITVDYPDRWIEISDLGLNYLRGKPLSKTDEKGGVIINPDLSVIAIPERLSMMGLYILKSFCELKSYDNVYTFQITRESFQEGLLLKMESSKFVDLLKRTSKNDLPQNLVFSIDEWSKTLPLVTITDECVVLQTQEADHMELLLGQISGKKIVLQRISPTTIVIDPDKIGEVIQFAEKLNLIVKLIR